MNTLSKHSKTIGTLGIALGVTALAVIGLRLTANPPADIPLPFGFSESPSLAGSITEIGMKNGISVKKVTFPAGTDSENLSMDTLYLVTVPNDVSITEGALDEALSIGVNHDVNYFGYKYTSADAAAEIANRDAVALTQRFPGQFFASAKARAEDPNHGNAIANFESANGVTMAATNTDTGALLTKNSLYFIVVNESSPVAMTVRHPVQSTCGNGAIEAGETCDDNDTDSGDGCSATCAVEDGYFCSESPSVCTAISTTPLSITVLPSFATANTTVGSQNIALLRFRATAGQDPLLLKSAMFGATTGNLSSLTNLSLWRTTGDGTEDVKVLDRSTNSTATVLVFFDASVAESRVLAAGESATFEVRGDIAAGAPVPSDIQIAFKTDLANFLSALNQTSNQNLGGIKTDGLCLFTCEIDVTTAPSTLFHIIAS